MRLSTLTLSLCLIASCGKGEVDSSDSAVDTVETGNTVDTGPFDLDDDGFDATEDCDDSNPNINPDATEVCDGIDNNCDTLTDDRDPNLDTSTADIWYMDTDGDGYGTNDDTVFACEQPPGDYSAVGDDCDDYDSDYNPGADESDCSDPNDYNCDGSTGYTDADEDGWAACEDCNDADPEINPAAAELCDLIDNNCDTLIDDMDPNLDEESATEWFTDSDGDNYGVTESSVFACIAPENTVDASNDCDDADADINPGATEVCDSFDNDCDTLIDDDDNSLDSNSATYWYKDDDADNYGDPDDYVETCEPPTDYTADNSDCDDMRDYINPGAIEICDGVDNDCDGETDEGDGSASTLWYTDSDGDGYGDPSSEVASCTQPSSTISQGGDCDDSDSSINPDASEVCDTVDNDCDSNIDDDDSSLDLSTATVWYADLDLDTYGSSTNSATTCIMPSGYTSDYSDCDDSSATSYPGADEYCDGIDSDCDGTIDESDALDSTTWYYDYDGDTYGDINTSMVECYQPTNYVNDTTDCDDTDSAINTSATEVCDTVDNDCNGDIDDDDSGLDSSTTTTFYADIDQDGYGDSSSTLNACDTPTGYTPDNTDCNDFSYLSNPGEPEVCDGLDNDCDSSTDEGYSATCDDITCSGIGLIGSISDGCLVDGGSTSNSDSLEVYCYNGITRFCLSGESCQWRASFPSTDDGTTCESSGLSGDYMANAVCSDWNGHTNFYCNTAEQIYF